MPKDISMEEVKKMHDVKGVIFDLDGVICFTDDFHYLAWKKIADELGIKVNVDFKDKIRGISRMDSLEILLGKYSSSFTSEEKKLLADRKNTYYQEMLKKMQPDDCPIGTIELLQWLHENKIKVAIGSSSRNARLILEKLGIVGLFDVIVDGSMVARSKPFPDVFLKASELLNLPPFSCVVVEDAYSGIEAAFNGGFIPVSIGTDGAKNQKKKYAISKLTDLIQIIQEYNS